MKKKLFGFVLLIALSVSYASSVLAADNYSLPWKGVEITEVTTMNMVGRQYTLLFHLKN